MARTWINPISGEISALEAAKKLNRFELARFHYFNANGIRAEWDALGKKILEAAEQGRCKNGAWLAYGPIGHYDSELYRFSKIKQFKVVELMVILNLIRETITRGEAFLATLPPAK